MGNKLIEMHRCPKCNSSQNYHRRRDNMRRCFSCGHEWPAAKKPISKKVSKAAA